MNKYLLSILAISLLVAVAALSLWLSKKDTNKEARVIVKTEGVPFTSEEGKEIVQDDTTKSVLSGKNKPADFSKTEVIRYTPSNILPNNTQDGSCWINSLSIRRSDAWRCMNNGSYIFDPCFELPQSEKVICPMSPTDQKDDLVLNLTKTLPKPDPQSAELQSEQPAWNIELQDGTSCVAITGASAVVGNERANFQCESGSFLMGDLKMGPLWTAKEVVLSPVDPQSGDFTLESFQTVLLRKVWQ